MKVANNVLSQPRDGYNKERGKLLRRWGMAAKDRPKVKPRRLDAALRKQHD